MIRSSRVFLHSDSIDCNAVAREITLEMKEKKLGALSRALGNHRQQAPKPVQAPQSPKTKMKMDLIKAKERENFDKYIKVRELRVSKMSHQRGKSMLAGILCSETRHLLRGGDEDLPKK
jgi:hypothetical protein